ncbi:16S rRNA (uracil(1498)-N(3))-methyltransferase [Paenibacillus sp. N1-5-1-14]|uniref:16S rRNA (uracil(1498)-N(3))-methyltransferase n=1 Tax=Paenibacillus radicibacter TaxID=2972488 RepID=UPI002158E898|nr:16S rRNA (uracil(1498)-N(3))-methyltransferase [Paenibacillus radicibacter]MCR8645697.1 16S rRNA (uracil(1498)-N(3))-methyltransferase [Paenibacillus radicibacter]
MQRYFIPNEQFHDQTVTITGDDAHHLVRVMRAEVGDECICSNGEDREAKVRIVEIEKGSVTAEIVEVLPLTAEASAQVWIAQSLPKGDKMELVIQKGTEIGAAGFIPFVSDRTVVQYDAKKEAKRSERWNKIAKEAAEQAHRNRVPRVESVLSWKNLMQSMKDYDAAWICYEKEGGLSFRELVKNSLKATDKPKLLLVIGPEGGFTEAEVADAEQHGCMSVSLGKRILRTETAAMVGLTCILYESGEMGV